MFERSEAEKEQAIKALEADLAETAGVLNAAHGRMVELISHALDQELWAQSGIHSPEQWLAWQLGLTAGHAHQIVAVARRSAELPVTNAALANGALSLDQAAVIARRCPADHEREVADFARYATVRQLSSTLRRYAFDEPGPEPEPPSAPPAPERRDVSFGGTDDGRWRLYADLPIDEGATIERALIARRRDLIEQAKADGEPEREVTWADALLSMAEHPGADRFQVIAHLEARRPHADTDEATGAGVASLHLGPTLPDHIRRLVTCDSTLQVQVDGEQGKPLSVGRKRRTVPDRLRHAVEHRDGGCRVPGCNRRRQLHIHHVIHWEDGGPTDTDNLIALCRPHHRLHHLGQLGIVGHADDPDGIVFTNRHGRRLQPDARPTKAGPAPPSAPYQHPLGERLQSWAVHFNPDHGPTAA